MELILSAVLAAIATMMFAVFQPNAVSWIRKKVGLEQKEPYYLKDYIREYLEKDPVIGSNLPPYDKCKWVLEDMAEQELDEYTFFLTPDKRRCVNIDRQNGRTIRRILLVKKDKEFKR